MYRKWSFSLLLVGMGCLLPTSAFAQTALRWQFTAGQTMQQTITQEAKMSAAVGEQAIDTTMTQTLDAVWRVGAVDAQGVAEVVHEIKRIRMKMVAAQGLQFEFDSSSDQPVQGFAAVMAPALKAMASAKFTMKMSPQGEILEVDVSQETLDALKSLPGAGQMGGIFSKDQLVNMIKQGTPAMPKTAVAIGDTWSSSMDMQLPALGKLASETTLTYAGPVEVEGKTLERIDMEVTVDLKLGAGSNSVAELKDSKARGAIYFDNAAGRLNHSELTQDMTIRLSMSGRAIDQKIHQVVKVQMAPGAN